MKLKRRKKWFVIYLDRWTVQRRADNAYCTSNKSFYEKDWKRNKKHKNASLKFNDKYSNDRKPTKKTNVELMKTFQRIYFREPRFLLGDFSFTHSSFCFIGIFVFFFSKTETDEKMAHDVCDRYHVHYE